MWQWLIEKLSPTPFMIILLILSMLEILISWNTQLDIEGKNRVLEMFVPKKGLNKTALKMILTLNLEASLPEEDELATF